MLELPESQPYPLPSYNPSKEKWVDLDGSKQFYLRMIFGAEKEPIIEVNFFNITTSSESKFVSFFYRGDINYSKFL
jgi:hypothetical protein